MGAASYHGDYEYYLAKKAATAQHSELHDNSLPLARNPQLETRNLVSKDERQRQREEEKHRQREERQRQKRLAELEMAIEEQEKLLAALEKRMAEPAFFADHEAAKQSGEEHALLAGRIAGLYAEWEALHSPSPSLTPLC